MYFGGRMKKQVELEMIAKKLRELEEVEKLKKEKAEREKLQQWCYKKLNEWYDIIA